MVYDFCKFIKLSTWEELKHKRSSQRWSKFNDFKNSFMSNVVLLLHCKPQVSELRGNDESWKERWSCERKFYRWSYSGWTTRSHRYKQS